jgi:hypothetical protein
VILVLRIVGVLNAAVWLGAAVFFTLAVGPAFFSPATQAVPVHKFYVGVIAEIVLGRYFYLQQICGVIAVVHLVAEWFYLGRPVQRLNVALLGILLFIGFAGGLWLQPKMTRLHLVKYGMNEQYQPAPAPMPERQAAAKSFARWHGVSMTFNLLALASLAAYFWRVTHPPDNVRLVRNTTGMFKS